jgi:hypothetical protein
MKPRTKIVTVAAGPAPQLQTRSRLRMNGRFAPEAAIDPMSAFDPEAGSPHSLFSRRTLPLRHAGQAHSLIEALAPA